MRSFTARVIKTNPWNPLLLTLYFTNSWSCGDATYSGHPLPLSKTEFSCFTSNFSLSLSAAPSCSRNNSQPPSSTSFCSHSDYQLPSSITLTWFLVVLPVFCSSSPPPSSTAPSCSRNNSQSLPSTTLT